LEWATGFFFLQREFTWWKKGGDGTAEPVLFCGGGPGVGKTYFRYEWQLLLNPVAILNSSNHSSLVIDTLCDGVDAENMAVACVYCDFHARDEQSTTRLFGCC